MNIAVGILRKERILSFLWQHILLLLSLDLMTVGVALCVKSCLGSSVISSLPLVCSLAGEASLAPALTIGDYTIIMNFVLVFCQILVLRRRFEPVQMFQLVIGFFFGWLIDLNMALFASLECDTLYSQIAAQFTGCTVMGVGIAFEVRCGSVTMPGEGISIALSKVTGQPFVKVKICVDTLLVVLAIVACYYFFGAWLWNVIGPGTLFAMVYVGLIVKFVTRRIGWFDSVLAYVPGFRRYIFGLARMLPRRNR